MRISYAFTEHEFLDLQSCRRQRCMIGHTSRVSDRSNELFCSTTPCFTTMVHCNSDRLEHSLATWRAGAPASGHPQSTHACAMSSPMSCCVLCSCTVRISAPKQSATRSDSQMPVKTVYRWLFLTILHKEQKYTKMCSGVYSVAQRTSKVRYTAGTTVTYCLLDRLLDIWHAKTLHCSSSSAP